jgi:hypothetical protein
MNTNYKLMVKKRRNHNSRSSGSSPPGSQYDNESPASTSSSSSVSGGNNDAKCNVPTFVRKESLPNWIHSFCGTNANDTSKNSAKDTTSGGDRSGSKSRFKVRVVSRETLSKLVQRKHTRCNENQTVKVEHMRVLPSCQELFVH